ncbi:hypothetical protein GAY33_17340 [Azospirillum brasilense]|uniref:hypothetical protein n=1 Tax=Azospirillum argentinense TaxID=2970906 RepID=UPI00190EF0A3|nr:hypothetical protein [Azospirillum argentinense]MBK3800969.1 hypothetical protein [Azospirillum argentinense]
MIICKPFSRLALILALSGLLGGCQSSVDVLGMPEVRGTGSTGQKKISILAANYKNKSRESFDESMAAIANVSDDIRQRCFGDAPNVYLPTLAGGAFVIPLIMAAAELGYSYASNSLKDAAVAKLERFKAPYNAQTNVNAADLRCIEFTRTMDGDKEPSSRIVLAFDKFGEDAIVVQPIYVKLNKFAASTSPSQDGPEVGLAVTVAIQTLVSNDGDLDIRHHERNLQLRKIKLGQVYGEKDYAASAILPRLSGRPATIAVSVTETGGDGLQTPEDFEKAFDAQSKIIWNGLGGSLNARLKKHFE